LRRGKGSFAKRKNKGSWIKREAKMESPRRWGPPVPPSFGWVSTI